MNKLKESLTYRESLQGDMLKRYDEKTTCIGKDPYTIHVDEFDNDETIWPELGYFDVIDFLVFQKSFLTKDQMKNYKSLDAYKMFQDGWVEDLLHKDFGDVHLFKAKVYDTTMIQEEPLVPWILVSPNGTIESAHCTCMADLVECCSHTVAFLYALEAAIRLRSEAVVIEGSEYWKYPESACSDVPCQRICDIDFNSPRKKRKRSSRSKTTNKDDTENVVQPPSPTQEEVYDFLRKLKEVAPNAAVLSAYGMSDAGSDS